MNNDEQKEIGELLDEITSKGFPGLMIDVDDELEGERVVSVNADCADHITQLAAFGSSLVETLGYIVDQIREMRNEPSREEELAALLAKDAAHALTLVHLGQDACCASCGSRNPLIVERKIKFLVDWADGSTSCPWFRDFGNVPQFAQAGEIGTCGDCEAKYTLRA